MHNFGNNACTQSFLYKIFFKCYIDIKVDCEWNEWHIGKCSKVCGGFSKQCMMMTTRCPGTCDGMLGKAFPGIPSNLQKPSQDFPDIPRHFWDFLGFPRTFEGQFPDFLGNFVFLGFLVFYRKCLVFLSISPLFFL